jgi:hypothetical protein
MPVTDISFCPVRRIVPLLEHLSVDTSFSDSETTPDALAKGA